MKVFDDDGNVVEHTLKVGDKLRMEKGQYHVHSNPFDETSYTLFKAEGDITEIVQALRDNFSRLD
jgi:hypothetical protein